MSPVVRRQLVRATRRLGILAAAAAAGTNSGSLLRDSVEGSGTAQWQLYGAREYGTALQRPELVLTWG